MLGNQFKFWVTWAFYMGAPKTAGSYFHMAVVTRVCNISSLLPLATKTVFSERSVFALVNNSTK